MEQKIFYFSNVFPLLKKVKLSKLKRIKLTLLKQALFLFLSVKILSAQTSPEKKSSLGEKFSLHSVSLYSGAVSTLNEEAGKSTVKYDAGIKLSVTNLNVMFSTGINSYSIQQIRESFLEDFFLNHKMRWGTQLRLPSALGFFSANFYAGTLTFSQGISRLKNPVISSSSLPLRSPVNFVAGFAPSIPSFTSTETPLSFAAELNPSRKLSFLPQVQFGCITGKDFFLNINKKFSTRFIPLITFSATGGFFTQSFSSSDSWFEKTPYFPEGKTLALEQEVCLTFPHARSSTAAAIYESPFGKNYTWIRSHNALVLKSVIVDSGFFIADSNLITTDSSMPKTKFQYYVNPQKKFHFGKCQLNSGIIFQQNFLETKDSFSTPYKTSSLKAALAFYRNLSAVTWNFSASHSQLTEEKTFTNKISFSRKFKPLTSNFSASLKTELQKQNLTFSESICFRKGFVSSLYFSASSDFDDWHFDKTKASASVSFSGGKKIKFSGKVQLNFSL